jgi:trigger factor
MTYQLTERLQYKVGITAELEAAVVERERKAILSSMRHEISLPGFRPGKVPLSMLRARFGDQIEHELREKLFGVAWREIVAGEEDLRPLGMPTVSKIDINDDGTFSLDAELEIRPRLELRPVEELTLPELSLEVADADIEHELEGIQKEQAAWEPADDEPAADGMRVDCEFHGEDIESGEEIVHEDNAGFVIGHPELFAEINEAMQGAHTGDKRSATKRFDESDPDPKRAGKTVRFDVTIKSLKREELPPIDDELAETIGFESLQQLKDRVREVLTQSKVRERDQARRRALLDQLGEDFDLNTLPESLVQSAISNELEEIEQMVRNQGSDPAQLDRSELTPKIEPNARRQVLDMLILDQLADEWDVEAEEMLEELIRAQAGQLGVPPAEHKTNLAREEKLDGIRYSVRISATVKEMIRRAGGEDE